MNNEIKKESYGLETSTFQNEKVSGDNYSKDIINEKIKVVEWFGGIGAFTHGIKRSGIPYKIVDYVELDKYAVKSYNAINGTNFVPTDINNVDVNNYGEVDILIAGWPCQDYSVAGYGKGLEGTRSSLILLTIDKVRQMTIKPKYILLENVKGLLADKHKQDLGLIKHYFKELGYNWDQALLNSKYFGVPQARERVFMLLTRNDLPQAIINHLEKRNTVDKVLRDVLDFSLPTQTSEAKEFIVNTMSNYNGKLIKVDYAKLNNQKRDEINRVAVLGELVDGNFEKVKVNQVNFFTGADGTYQTYTDNHGTGNQILWQDHSFNQKKDLLGIDGVAKTLRAGDCDAENKVMWKDIPFQQDKTFQGIEGVGQTLLAQGSDLKGKIIYEDGIIHYRKLSSLECWRLMGFSDEAHNACVNAGVSSSQLCKQAGNSIVVSCLEAIVKQIF